jgi:hypothetical protein
MATEIPRRGFSNAVAWPDTGVLLGLGTDKGLLDRLSRRYQGRIFIAKTVASELRFHSNRATDGLTDDAYDRVAAATTAVHALLISQSAIATVGVGDEDLPEIARVAQQLKARSGDQNKRHGGEAEIIVLASKQASRDGRTHVLLTNDGGASIIAHQHGLSSRHIGDVLAEFACADPALGPDVCYQAFNAAVRLSAPPKHSLQSKIADFTCLMAASGCVVCDGHAGVG